MGKRSRRPQSQHCEPRGSLVHIWWPNKDLFLKDLFSSGRWTLWGWSGIKPLYQCSAGGLPIKHMSIHLGEVTNEDRKTEDPAGGAIIAVAGFGEREASKAQMKRLTFTLK